MAKEQKNNSVKFNSLHSEINFDDVKNFLNELTLSEDGIKQEVEKTTSTEENKFVPNKKISLVSIIPNSTSEIISVLNEHICDVQFKKVTFPNSLRTLKCTLNEKLMNRKSDGTGYMNGIIKTIDLETGEWKSFYPQTVKKITYEDNSSDYA
jgi:hypothetical protein